MKNEIWAANLDTGAEVKVDLPENFDVREGHALLIFVYNGSIERYVNVTTEELNTTVTGLFNKATMHITIGTKDESSCLMFFLGFLPWIGSLFSLTNITYKHSKFSSVFKKYTRVFYNRIANWFFTLLILAVVGYQFKYYSSYILATWDISWDINDVSKYGQMSILAVPVIFLFISNWIRHKRKARFRRFLGIHSKYLTDTAFTIVKQLKASTDILERSTEVYNKITGKSQASGVSADTKECPECAEIIKLNARKCRFCGSVLSEE